MLRIPHHQIASFVVANVFLFNQSISNYIVQRGRILFKHPLITSCDGAKYFSLVNLPSNLAQRARTILVRFTCPGYVRIQNIFDNIKWQAIYYSNKLASEKEKEGSAQLSSARGGRRRERENERGRKRNIGRRMIDMFVVLMIKNWVARGDGGCQIRKHNKKEKRK